MKHKSVCNNCGYESPRALILFGAECPECCQVNWRSESLV